MNRRHLLASAVLAALVGCSAESLSTVPATAPPPAGAKLVVLKLPGMV
ncbi:MAG: hypothetical protein L0211_04115 [Planctomycetaceae bacterium]|nr:hypothetical protein [Planctomycetaceae bacterium]